jgi:hypothetical protein
LKRTATLIALLAALALAPTASAGSIVFLKGDGNVALTDGVQTRAVTADGTASNPYGTPSQADDGTIVATRGTGENEQIVRMTRTGQVLNAFNPVVELDLGLDDARVSPDGLKVAYTTTSSGSDPQCQYCTIFAISSATGPQNLGSDSTPLDGNWVTSNTYAGGNGRGSIYTNDVGSQNAVYWFNGSGSSNSGCQGCDGYLLEPDVAGGRVAFVEDAFFGSGFDVVIATMSGAPPAPVTHTRCRIPQPASGGTYHDLSFEPGGGALVWYENNANDRSRQGLWVSAVTGTSNADNCGMGARFLTAGTDPDWGPTPLDAAAGGGGGGGSAPGEAGVGPPHWQSLAKLLSQGYRFTVGCPSACKIDTTLLISARDARRLGIISRSVAVGKSRKSLPAAGSRDVTTKLTKKARRRLKRARKVKLTVRVKITEASGKVSRFSGSVVFKRSRSGTLRG